MILESRSARAHFESLVCRLYVIQYHVVAARSLDAACELPVPPLERQPAERIEMSKSNFPIPSAALTVDEAADYIRVSRATIWRLLRNKLLARARIGGRTVVRRIDLDAFLARAVEAA